MTALEWHSVQSESSALLNPFMFKEEMCWVCIHFISSCPISHTQGIKQKK